MTWDHLVYGAGGAAAVAVAGTAVGLVVSWCRRTRRPAPSPPPTVVVVQQPPEPVTQILPQVLERDLPGREPPWRWVNATDPAVTRILPAQRDRSRT